MLGRAPDAGSHHEYIRNASTVLFGLVCFYVGIAVLTLVFLGQIRFDDRDGPGFNPFTRLPNGKVGISEFGAEVVGFCVLLAAGWPLGEALRR